MTNLEKNFVSIKKLFYSYPEKFKDVKVVNGNLIYNDKVVSIRQIDIENILTAKENIIRDLISMDINEIFDILRINATILQSSLKSSNRDILEHNKAVTEKMKDVNKLIKNVMVINKTHNYSIKQYFSVVDSNGFVHIFKNDRSLDISKVYENFVTSNSEENLDRLIDLLERTLPEVHLVSTLNLDNNSEISEDFYNKLK